MLLNLNQKIMKNDNCKIDPETRDRLIKLTVAILTAIIGFFTGAGVQAATVWIG